MKYFSFAVLDLVRTVQRETGGAKIEGHVVDPGPVPTPDHLHGRIAGPIPVPDLVLFPRVGPILDHLELYSLLDKPSAYLLVYGIKLVPERILDKVIPCTNDLRVIVFCQYCIVPRVQFIIYTSVRCLSNL